MSADDKKSETPRPFEPVKGERPGKGVLVSHDTLVRRREQGKPPILPGPKGPTQAA